LSLSLLFFFFTDTAPTEIYTLSLHDALPILPSASPPPRSRVIAILSSSPRGRGSRASQDAAPLPWAPAFAGMTGRKWGHGRRQQDRKSTRLNSSHVEISYAVFCLKKKKKKKT